MLHSEIKSINVMNEKIGITKEILYKISVERQNKYKAISSNDLNNPLNPPFLRGNCNPRCPGRNVGKDKPLMGEA